VTVGSELGKGTRFRLTFPAIPNDIPIAVDDEEQELAVGVNQVFSDETYSCSR